MIKLKIEENYLTFNHFLENNKYLIYTSIINIFKDLLTTNKNEITLNIEAKIDNLEWETDFIYTKNDKNTLIKDILPYFEMIEDYNVCVDIKKIVKKLNGE